MKIQEPTVEVIAVLFAALEETPQLPCVQTRQEAYPCLIEKEGANQETGLTVVINAHVSVFLMGYLIKNLLVAAGSLSLPVTTPLCQNRCHRAPVPSPTHPP